MHKIYVPNKKMRLVLAIWLKHQVPSFMFYVYFTDQSLKQGKFICLEMNNRQGNYDIIYQNPVKYISLF